MPKDLKMPVICTCYMQLVALFIYCVGVKLGVRKRGAEVLIWSSREEIMVCWRKLHEKEL